MSHLLRKSFKSHHRTQSTPAGPALKVTDKNPRNTLPSAKTALTVVPEHEELRSSGKRHGSLGSNATGYVAHKSVDEAKTALAKYRTQTSASVSLPKNRDWLRLLETIPNLFNARDVPLKHGEMAVLHEKIRTLSSSKAGPFLFDSFKREVEVCFTALLQKLQEIPRENLLQVLSSEWENLFRHVLSTLDMILYVVKSKSSTSVRQAFLVAFGDTLVTKLDPEDLLSPDTGSLMPDGIRHMLLILYISLHCDRSLRSHISYGVPLPRKLSRPMSSQPRQIEALHELFLTALRKQPDF